MVVVSLGGRVFAAAPSSGHTKGSMKASSPTATLGCEVGENDLTEAFLPGLAQSARAHQVKTW